MKHLLGGILTAGNCLNANDDKRGQADGFELEAILKTKNIIETNSKKSLF